MRLLLPSCLLLFTGCIQKPNYSQGAAESSLNPSYQITLADGRCLAASPGFGIGRQLFADDCDGPNLTKFSLIPKGSHYQIATENSHCLEVPWDHGDWDFQRIIENDCRLADRHSGSLSQLWSIDNSRIKNAKGKCLDREREQV